MTFFFCILIFVFREETGRQETEQKDIKHSLNLIYI